MSYQIESPSLIEPNSPFENKNYPVNQNHILIDRIGGKGDKSVGYRRRNKGCNSANLRNQ